MTDEGAQPVDWLRAGDRVMTRDHGFQQILWADRTVVPAAASPLRPIQFSAGCAGHNIPEQDLHLPPDFRILLKSPQIELLFGCREAFSPASTTTNGHEIFETQLAHEVSYFHILFAQHQVVLAEGLWVESFFPEEMALAALPADKQAQIRGLLGAQTDTMQTARYCLKSSEATLLMPQNTRSIQQHLSVA